MLNNINWSFFNNCNRFWCRCFLSSLYLSWDGFGQFNNSLVKGNLFFSNLCRFFDNFNFLDKTFINDSSFLFDGLCLFKSVLDHLSLVEQLINDNGIRNFIYDFQFIDNILDLFHNLLDFSVFFDEVNDVLDSFLDTVFSNLNIDLSDWLFGSCFFNIEREIFSSFLNNHDNCFIGCGMVLNDLGGGCNGTLSDFSDIGLGFGFLNILRDLLFKSNKLLLGNLSINSLSNFLNNTNDFLFKNFRVTTLGDVLLEDFDVSCDFLWCYNLSGLSLFNNIFKFFS